MCSVCTDLHPDGQHKLQPLVSSSGGLLKILIELQQWSAPELWRRMCFRMLLVFWTLFLSYSLFMLILVSQKFVSAGKICTINLNKMFKPLSEKEASCDLGYPEYTPFNHRLKLRINGINRYWVLESKYWNSWFFFFSPVDSVLKLTAERKSFQTEWSKAVWCAMMPMLSDSESTWIHPGTLVCLVTALQQHIEKALLCWGMPHSGNPLSLFKLCIQENTSLLNFRNETQFCRFFKS